MNKVDVAGGPLLVVLDEAVVEVAAGHVVLEVSTALADSFMRSQSLEVRIYV